MKRAIEKKTEIIFWLFVIAMWIALYWKQCVIDNLNDFLCHTVFAKLIVEGKLMLVYPGYHIPVGLLAKLLGIPETQASVFVLTFAQILSILVTAEILRALSDIWKSGLQLLIASFLLNVVQPIFFYNYKPGASSGNGLFSPTLTMVKPFTLLVILLFYQMYKRKEYSIKIQLYFLISMIITALVKPMFLMAFIPAAGILLFLESIENIRIKKVRVGAELLSFILRVMPLFLTGLVLIAQFIISANYKAPANILPEGIKLSTDSDSHIRIGFMRSWSLAVDNVYISLIFTYLFPIVVFTIISYYAFKKRKSISEMEKEKLLPFRNITISYGIVSFLIMAFLYQEGREIDMNFRNAWVVTFNLVYILSFVYISELAKITQTDVKQELGNTYTVKAWLMRNKIFGLAMATWGIHMLFGAALIIKYTIG